MQYAMSLVSEATKARYLKEGKPFLVEEDSQYHTGITWQSSGFTFQSEATHVKVRVPHMPRCAYLNHMCLYSP